MHGYGIWYLYSDFQVLLHSFAQSLVFHLLGILIWDLHLHLKVLLFRLNMNPMQKSDVTKKQFLWHSDRREGSLTTNIYILSSNLFSSVKEPQVPSPDKIELKSLSKILFQFSLIFVMVSTIFTGSIIDWLLPFEIKAMLTCYLQQSFLNNAHCWRKFYFLSSF